MARVEQRGGRPVLVRSGGRELRREAELLQAVAGDGVPEVVDLAELGDGRVELLTTFDPPLSPASVDPWRVGAMVATVLARSHEQGIVHGAVHREHLREGPGGVVLAGWDRAGPGDPGADVTALGRLLEELADSDVELSALLRRVRSPTAPSMDTLARALADGPRRRGHAGRRRFLLPAVGTGVAVLAVAVGAALAPASPPPARPVSLDRSGSPPPTDVRATAQAPATTAATLVAVVHGNVVTRAGSRWEVGRPGDVVVLGDWDCDGEASPAVLRPVTGAVWIFAGWSPGGAPVAGRLLGHGPGAVALRVSRRAGCDDLLVTDAKGVAVPFSGR